jgi:hypothetical protein
MVPKWNEPEMPEELLKNAKRAYDAMMLALFPDSSAWRHGSFYWTEQSVDPSTKGHVPGDGVGRR